MIYNAFNLKQNTAVELCELNHNIFYVRRYLAIQEINSNPNPTSIYIYTYKTCVSCVHQIVTMPLHMTCQVTVGSIQFSQLSCSQHLNNGKAQEQLQRIFKSFWWFRWRGWNSSKVSSMRHNLALCNMHDSAKVMPRQQRFYFVICCVLVCFFHTFFLFSFALCMRMQACKLLFNDW